ncbi:MAG: PQQ-binding-like beta-propeller repeat protein [Planctomycetaceae bacterium]
MSRSGTSEIGLNDPRTGTIRYPRCLTAVILVAFLLLQPCAGLAPGFAAEPAGSSEDAAEAAKEADESSEGAREVSGSPLERLIRWIFDDGETGSAARGDADGDERDGGSTDRDAVDARAPHDAKIEHQLRTAETLIRNGDWKQAAPLLQKLLELPEDSLHRLPDRRWQSVRVTANRLLGTAPREVLDEYQQQHGGLSRQLLTLAFKEGDLQEIVHVALRYFHTAAGQEAADWLASVHQDHGEFHLAALWLEQLLAIDAPLTKTVSWRLRALSVAQRAGRTELVRRLTAGPVEETGFVLAAGRKVAFSEWMKSLGSPEMPMAETPEDWRMLGGTSSRQGIQSGSAPFLRPIWNMPYSANHQLCQQIEELTQDLADQSRPAVLVCQPLAVSGKLIYRDLRGVRAVDLHTGKGLWESIEGVSAERILTGTAGNSPFDGTESTTFDRDSQDPFDGHQSEFHPLTSLLFRDAAYQSLSSDGRQVFLLEDHGILSRQQPGFQWGWDGEPEEPSGLSWTTNRLSSYDLETGRLLWTVGGAESGETFRLPLEGVFFHGAPTPDGDELFAIGSRGDEVRLWSLDRRTGGLNWSQLIAFADSKVDQDIGRRWMAALPSVSDGVVVCPTTLGWLVAIDRLRHGVLWARRYAPVNPDTETAPGSNFVPQQELGDQWGPSAPIIAGQSVVFTPPEDDHLFCVDLMTGRQRWRLDRAAGQYLLGVDEGRVVIVSQSDIAAYSLRNGSPLWSCAFRGGAHASGRGILTGDCAYVPLDNGELLIAVLANGESRRLTSPLSGAPLGNLLMHRGLVASLSANGLTAFRQEAALWADLQRRKAENPRDTEALLGEGEIHLANRRDDLALEALRQISMESLPAELQSRVRQAFVQALAATIRRNPAGSEAELAELGRLVTSPDDRLLQLDLSAERLLALNRHHDAFLLYWPLTQETAGGWLERKDVAHVRVDRSVWLGGRLHDIWLTASEEDRERIDVLIRDVVHRASAERETAPAGLVNQIGFHPDALPLRQQRIETLWNQGDFAATELELIRLSMSADRGAAAWATWKLADVMEAAHLPDDAVHWYRRLESAYGPDQLPSGRTGAETVQELRGQNRLPFERPATASGWSDGPIRVVRSAVQTLGQPEHEVSLASPPPFLASLDMELLPQEQRLQFHGRAGREFEWLAPLRISSREQHAPLISAASIGQTVAVIHQDVLHVLSPVEKKVLWRQVLPSVGEGSLSWQASPQTCALWSLSQDDHSEWSLMQQASQTGRLAAVQARYLAVHGRRSIDIFDPLTGTELWRREHVASQTKVVGGPDSLWIFPPDAGAGQVYRAADGAPLKIKDPARLLAKALSFVGNDLLLVEPGPGIKFFSLDSLQTVVRRYDPVNDITAWKLEFGPKSTFTLLNENELLVVQSNGAVELIDTWTGGKRGLEPLAAKDMPTAGERFAVVDDELLYLIVNRQDSGGFHNFGESLPSMPVHGMVFAWQRGTGRLLWKQSITKQHLILDHFRSCPLMVFCTREWKQRGNANFSLLNLLVLHKSSGKIVHESAVPTMHNSFHGVGVSFTEPSVELKAHNLRIKLLPGRKASAGDPPTGN